MCFQDPGPEQGDLRLALTFPRTPFLHRALPTGPLILPLPQAFSSATAAPVGASASPALSLGRHSM